MDREFDIYRIPISNGQGKFNNFNVSFASTNQGSTDRLVRGPSRSANKKFPCPRPARSVYQKIFSLRVRPGPRIIKFWSTTESQQNLSLHNES